MCPRTGRSAVLYALVLARGNVCYNACNATQLGHKMQKSVKIRFRTSAFYSDAPREFLTALANTRHSYRKYADKVIVSAMICPHLLDQLMTLYPSMEVEFQTLESMQYSE